MSTFVFAPSWITYPNNPKTLKKETDEFPTLNSHNKINNNTEKKEHNVWLNPSLIQKIHHSGGEEDGEEVDFEENKYELERLKALVPKTKKSLSASSSSTKNTKRNIRLNYKQLKVPNHKHSSRQVTGIKDHTTTTTTTTTIITTATTTTTTTTTVPSVTIKAPDSSPPILPTPTPKPPLTQPIQTIRSTPTTPKYYISVQEQQHFIYFLKSWTSTSITSNNNYSYFNNNNNISISSNYSHSSHSSNSSDSSFQSDTTLYTSNSYFHHDPFSL
ncbi:hypothetical protein BD770DRAFT_384940 [Pilaira anomala]|nr:hypothetical protein BD770DRAFT_384940 [Pilaira anomala]